MKTPLISILTPFKNSAPYLEECLNSIIIQSHSNWELLIVDDHSTDESFDIVEKYSNQDARIKVYKNQGNGIIETLRLAFKMSSGKFITRMDSDDIMAPNKLLTMMKQLEVYGPEHVALGKVEYFSQDGIGSGYANYARWLNELIERGENYNDIYRECVIPSPCWMVYREDLLIVGAFNPNIYPEDYDLAFRFYAHQLTCIPSDKLLHFWRDYPTRTSRTHDHYAENHFLKLKLSYFLKLDRDPDASLVIWGAGAKGKRCARFLIGRNISFVWICNNPKKIGHTIYNIPLESTKHLDSLLRPQIIVTVANKIAQKAIRCKLESYNFKKTKDYYFFC